MHGRIKTITTAEQQLKQKKNREAKLAAYRAAINILLEKRKLNELDDEAMTLTRDILQANPDIITVWNIRREIILAKKDAGDYDFQSELAKELLFTELCLRVNPKSYGTWHHRIWVLDLMPTEVWQKEVDLCDKYLSMDERNFHCWDYRKFVVAKANVDDYEEYKFTTNKIHSNFSNYSAWHYRSKLLPRIFSNTDGTLPLEEQKHKEELEMVQNAAFTDPDDQSAWFYQRWLLGLLKPKLLIINAQICEESVSVALSQSIQLHARVTLSASMNGSLLTESWEGTAGRTSSLFILRLKDPVEEGAKLTIELKATEGVTLDTIEVTQKSSFVRLPHFSPECGSDLKETLLEQLTYCQQLLDLEPNSKWTLLTSVFLMHSIGLNQYSNEIVSLFSRLINVDPLRKGYYTDMLSKIRMELALTRANTLGEFSISDNLSCLYHTQYLSLTTKVSFEDNNLEGVHLKKLHSLVNCCYLSLAKNKIECLAHLPVLKNLKELCIKDNPLKDASSCRVYLERFPKLTEIEF